MTGAIVATTGGHDSLFATLVIPLFVALVTGGLLIAALYGPVFKDRAAKQRDAEARNERLDRTMDFVLGCPADPKTGKDAQEGLVRTIPRLVEDVRVVQHSVGAVNGDGRSVMGHVVELRKKVEDMGLGQVTLSEHFDTHMILDDQRFADVNRQVGGLQQSVRTNTQSIEETKSRVDRLTAGREGAS